MLKYGFLNLSRTLGVFAAKSCISLLRLPSQLQSEKHLLQIWFLVFGAHILLKEQLIFSLSLLTFELSLLPSVSILPLFDATAPCILPSVILHHVCETPPAKVP